MQGMKNAPRQPQPGHPRPNVTRQPARRCTKLQGRGEERAFQAEQGTGFRKQEEGLGNVVVTLPHPRPPVDLGLRTR